MTEHEEERAKAALKEYIKDVMRETFSSMISAWLDQNETFIKNDILRNRIWVDANTLYKDGIVGRQTLHNWRTDPRKGPLINEYFIKSGNRWMVDKEGFQHTINLNPAFFSSRRENTLHFMTLDEKAKIHFNMMQIENKKRQGLRLTKRERLYFKANSKTKT